MKLQSLPVVTGAPCSAPMAPSSSTYSTVITHGRFPCLTTSTTHSFLAGILPSNMVSYSGLPEQPSSGNFSRLSPEAINCADSLGDGVENNTEIYSVESHQISGFVRTVRESDDSDEWLTSLMNGVFDDIITTDITSNCHQMPESAHVPSIRENDEHRVHPSVSVPSEPEQLYPIASPLETTNAHCPKRAKAKARMRWTMEMHDRFIDAVNLLGGSESAKPKAILDIMNVEGLTRDQVKSHLQKYKMAAVKHRPSEGTSVETTMCNEVIISDVQKQIQEYALKVQVELQKKLHDVVEGTFLEIHRSIQKYMMSLHELEQRQTNRPTLNPVPGPAAAWSTSLSAGVSREVLGERSNTAAALDDEAGLANQATEAGSPGNDAGA